MRRRGRGERGEGGGRGRGERGASAGEDQELSFRPLEFEAPKVAWEMCLADNCRSDIQKRPLKEAAGEASDQR